MLLDGKELCAEDVKSFGTNSLFKARAALERQGHRFTSQKKDGYTYWRLAQPTTGVANFDTESISGRAVARMVKGEAISNRMLQDEYGASSGLLHQLISSMRKKGLTVTQTDDGYILAPQDRGRVVFKPLNELRREANQRTAAQRKAGQRGPKRRSPKRAPVASLAMPPATNPVEVVPPTPPALVLPGLDDVLTVTLLAKDEGGAVRVGLRSGPRLYLCELVGTTEKG